MTTISARLRAWPAIQKRGGRPWRKGTNLADADMAKRVGDVDIETQSLDGRAEAETQSFPGNGAPPVGAVLLKTTGTPSRHGLYLDCKSMGSFTHNR
jgi:hypothetical protein